MLKLPLSNSSDFFTIDDQDSDRVSRYTWGEDKAGYVRAFKGKEKIYLHRLIANAKKGEYVDHQDRNKKNCQRNNLRICTQAQNRANSVGRTRSTSVYKGVNWDKTRKKFLARLGINGKGKNLGRFDNEIEAAKAYNNAAVEHYGEFAKLNEV